MFYKRWNYPNCIGAVDGKLVRIQRPTRCGARYFNYKKTYSLNLMAIVDASYKFIYINFGAQGSANDASVYNACSFARKLADNRNPLNIPPDARIPGTGITVPYMLVGDEAFPMRPFLMKPYSSRGLCKSERIFNYRLSRARRVVENAFGILANRFRIFHHPIQLNPSSVEDVVLATCALHNYLRHKTMNNDKYEQDEHESENDDDDIGDIATITHTPRDAGSNYNAASKKIRDTLADFFVGVGQVSWQWKHANIKPVI